MTNNEVVDIIAKKKIVESIVWKITSSGATAADPDSLQDLIQDIYLSLLEDKNIVDVWEEGHENYYIARIITNNIMSTTSRYYRKYLLPLKLGTTINEEITRDIKDGN